MSSTIRYTLNLPTPARLRSWVKGTKQTCLLIIFDRKLKSKETFSKWLGQFSFRYGVQAGEKLKEMKHFSHHVHRLNRLVSAIPTKNLIVISVGGGSVGDFAGFFASIYKRGVGLIHLPSTWLAAIDSAHGGKTALNLAGAKNQIGTFYPAQVVVLCRNLLATQPPVLHASAYAELFKIALISGEVLYRQTVRLPNLSTSSLWTVLPKAVTAKQKIVKSDPLEKKGPRQVLNLGHTLGHVVEAIYGIPHGMAVALGIKFTVQWGTHRGTTTKTCCKKVVEHLTQRLEIDKLERHLHKKKRIPTMTLKRLLQRDKKLTKHDKITFVFLNQVGKCKREQVKIEEVLKEMRRQGW